MEKLKQLVIAEEGQSLVEYGLILGLVSVGLVAALTALKKQGLQPIFTAINTALKGAASSN